VNLIGWSGGGPRAGGYAARHPEKVNRLFLYAPAYNRLAPSDPPAVLPDSGLPMTVLGRANFHDLWDTQVSCVNQFTPAIRDVITFTMLKFDTVGSTWGTAGVRRAPVWSAPGPGFALWGWNAKFSAQVVAPTLLIRGDADTQVPAANVMSLYADLGSAQKVFIHVACASHYLVWENQHRILLSASEEWLRDGTFAGIRRGPFLWTRNNESTRSEGRHRPILIRGLANPERTVTL
jgi:pimeloyl-ACP methyl ester carboxylesterase